MKGIKIKNANFEDAIKVLQGDRAQYGKKGGIPITNEFEKGYVKGLEDAIYILKETQRTLEGKQ